MRGNQKVPAQQAPRGKEEVGSCGKKVSEAHAIKSKCQSSNDKSMTTLQPNPDQPEPNPNSEIRNSKQIQMTKKDNLKRLS
jgi:hypothetical protein